MPVLTGPVVKALVKAILAEVLKWTGGQPFLTQKLCQLICNSNNFIGSSLVVIFSVIIFRFKLTVTVYILLYRYHDMNIHVVL